MVKKEVGKSSPSGLQKRPDLIKVSGQVINRENRCHKAEKEQVENWGSMMKIKAAGVSGNHNTTQHTDIRASQSLSGLSFLSFNSYNVNI